MATQFFPDIYRGDTWKHRFTVTLEGGITSCGIRFQIRKKYEGGAVLIDLDCAEDETEGNGISKISATQFELEITDDESAELTSGRHVADVQFTLPDGTTETMRNIDKAILVVSDVTRD